MSTIQCPKCNHEFEAEQALSAHLEAEYRQKLAEETTKLQKSIRQREKKIEKDKEQMQESIDASVKAKLTAQAVEVKKKAEAAVAVKMQGMAEELAEAKEKREAAEKAELALRKDKRKLEEDREKLELEVTRQLDEGRAIIRKEALKQADEENRLKLKEKDLKLEGMMKTIEDLKRKAEQGSQQTQGEALELDLESMLARTFPHDVITPIGKGVRGADVQQSVHDDTGSPCGVILWESKYTKSWSKGWLPKLRDDQREAKADLAVLITEAMPKDLDSFGRQEGIWITNRTCAVGLAEVLRDSLLAVSQVRRSITNRGDKMDRLYDYLSGPNFRRRLDGILEGYNSQKKTLEKEKKVMLKLWAEREQQLTLALTSTTGLYGDLQGIAREAVPVIEELELKALEPAEAR